MSRRLLFLTQTHTVWGGMEWWIHHLAQRLAVGGWSVYGGLAQGAKFSDARAYHAAHPHLQPVVMHAEVGNESSRLRAVRSALRQVRPDVVIPVGIGTAFDAMRSSEAAFLVPVLSMNEGWLANVFEWRDVVDRAVANSRLLEKVLLCELPDQMVGYVRQGAPLARYPRSLCSNNLRVAIISRLEEASKRVLDLVRVADHLDGSLGVEFHVYGDGPDRERLEKAMRGRAVFHGFWPTPDLYRDAYPNIDVLLLFSPTEGSPTAVYEAMHNGVVPVSSRFIGCEIEGILLDGVNALLFDVGDLTAATDHLRMLSSDRPRLEKLSRAARDMTETYDDEAMYDGWIHEIESVNRVHPRRPPTRLPPAGRLERAGMSASMADRVRRFARLRFPHSTGWEEWPGSQPVTAAALERVRRRVAQMGRGSTDG